MRRVIQIKLREGVNDGNKAMGLRAMLSDSKYWDRGRLPAALSQGI